MQVSEESRNPDGLFPFSDSSTKFDPEKHLEGFLKELASLSECDQKLLNPNFRKGLNKAFDADFEGWDAKGKNSNISFYPLVEELLKIEVNRKNARGVLIALYFGTYFPRGEETLMVRLKELLSDAWVRKLFVEVLFDLRPILLPYMSFFSPKQFETLSQIKDLNENIFRLNELLQIRLECTECIKLFANSLETDCELGRQEFAALAVCGTESHKDPRIAKSFRAIFRKDSIWESATLRLAVPLGLCIGAEEESLDLLGDHFPNNQEMRKSIFELLGLFRSGATGTSFLCGAIKDSKRIKFSEEIIGDWLSGNVLNQNVHISLNRGWNSSYELLASLIEVLRNFSRDEQVIAVIRDTLLRSKDRVAALELASIFVPPEIRDLFLGIKVKETLSSREKTFLSLMGHVDKDGNRLGF